jgi:hypothetical protein
MIDQDRFADACTQLAREVVHRGHTLIVGNREGNTADYFAVRGAAQALVDRDPRAGGRRDPPVRIITPMGQPEPFEAERRANPGLVGVHRVPMPDKSLFKLLLVRNADGVVICGGEVGSYQAGVAAALAGKRIVPVGSFGGAGRELINYFRASRQEWGKNIPTEDSLYRLDEFWSDGVRTTVLEQLGVEQFPKLLVIHGRSSDRDDLVAFLKEDAGVPRPVILVEDYLGTLTIAEKFETLTLDVDGAIAVVTPDDVGGPAGRPKDLGPRTRENVWMEVGWAWGKLGRDRCLLLCKEDMQLPSDWGGVEAPEYTERPSDCADVIRMFLRNLGGLGEKRPHS